MAWTYKRKITIDYTKCGSANSSNYPMLFAGTYTYLKTVANGGNVKSSSGYDIAFFSDAALTTMLDFERVRWVDSTGVCEFWVKIGTLSASANTVIYLAYGNGDISTDQQDPDNTWDTSIFAGVWHLEGNSLDSTSGNHDGSDTNVTYGTSYGKNGGQGARFQGNGYILINDHADFDTVAQSLEAWVYPTDVSQTWNGVIGHENDTGGTPYNACLISSNSQVGAFYYPGADRYYYDSGLVSVSLNTWQHLWNGYNAATGLNGLVNITNDGSASANGDLSTVPGYVRIGTSAVAGRNFNGYIDEARIYKIKTSASWNTANYNNQNSPSTFYSIGNPMVGNMQINIGDTWKTVTNMQINIGDSWKQVTGAQINIGDTWKPIF